MTQNTQEPRLNAAEAYPESVAVSTLVTQAVGASYTGFEPARDRSLDPPRDPSTPGAHTKSSTRLRNLLRRWRSTIRSTSLGDVLRNRTFFWGINIATYLLCTMFVVASYSLCGWCESLLPKNAHDSTTSQAFNQMIAIACVGALWFSAYLPRQPLSNRKGMALLICAPAAFALSLAMRNLYNPAVFFMGLAAVFVAAEHFGGLKSAADDINREALALEKQAGLLTKQNQALEEQAGVLERSNKSLEAQAEVLKEQTNGIREQTSGIRDLLDNYGLGYHRPKIFRHYATAKKRIDVVLRVLDIDHQWWKLVAGLRDVAADMKTTDVIWNRYFNWREDVDGDGPSADGLPDLTLYQALIPGDSSMSREDKVQFVCRLPTWEVDEAQWTPQQFETLLGLAWRLVVLDKVRETRRAAWRDRPESSPYVRIIAADCPCWIHAIDGIVYEVQPNASALQQSRVRQTGNEPRRDLPEQIHGERGRTTGGQSDAQRRTDYDEQQELSADLERWAHDEVRRYGRSGGLAADYVCALFRFLSLAYPNSFNPNLLVERDLTYVLRRLGFDRWADWRVSAGARELGLPPIERATAQLACWCIFSGFFEAVVKDRACNTSDLARVIL